VFVNKWLLAEQGFDIKILVGTGLTAMTLALVDKASPELATGLAYVLLVTVLFTRVSSGTPAPVENLSKIL
jgi:hypothetical protein